MAVESVTPLTAADQGVSRLRKDRERLDTIDRYVRGEHDGPYTPKSATAEYKLLAKRAVSNWLPLLVKTPAQALAVEGYRRQDSGPEGAASSVEWLAWQANRMDARQTAIHRAALAFGLAFVVVLPSPRDSTRPVIRGVSPRLIYAAYDDPAADETPLWALQLETLPQPGKGEVRAWFYDPQGVTELAIGGRGGARITGYTRHGLGVTPVVRFAADIDLEGRVTGVVEPMIPIQDRINQTTFDLLVAQTFGSFKVRTIAGLAPEFERDPKTGEIIYENGKPKVIPVQADASRFLVAPDPDTKFAQLDETPLAGFLEAIESAVRTLAAVSQTPPHYLLGSVVNLSAEALAAAEAALTRAVDEYKHLFGESWELVLRLCARVAQVAEDERAQVLWKDAESRSLSQTVDALGKAVQLLQVPPRALWPRIPGVTSTDVEEWAQMAEDDDPALRLADSLTRATAPASEGTAGDATA
ncbi:phage portal protein [Streptomyces radicis]|uniref:Phage portal protein n=1 Tax=Streptomyces radicis TaxID=1750517 RepID=A0A3A9W9T5_9ACTN|nr:phage portal protein [Streptomyces radicis]RKN09650.1 phage portal protein [Streptomyces radicis]